MSLSVYFNKNTQKIEIYFSNIKTYYCSIITYFYWKKKKKNIAYSNEEKDEWNKKQTVLLDDEITTLIIYRVMVNVLRLNKKELKKRDGWLRTPIDKNSGE